MVDANTKLSIYNGALIELGQTVLSSLTSGDEETLSTLNNQFPNALRTTLKAQNWDFASTYARPNLISSAANDTPYQYQYQLPNDFLKFQKVVDVNQNKVDYENNKDGLYTDANPVIIKYTAVVENYSQFDDDFIKLLSYNLAEACAEALTGHLDKEDFLDKKTDKLESIAASKSVGKSKYKYSITDNSPYLNIRG